MKLNLSLGAKSFLSGIVISLTGAVLLGIINYLIRRTLALRLSLEEFGFFYSLFAMVNLVTTLFLFGVKQAGTILTAGFLAKNQKKRINSLISILIVFTFSCGFFLMIAMFFCRNLLADYFFRYPQSSTAIALFSPILLLLPIWSILLGFLHGRKDFVTYNLLYIFCMGGILLGCIFSIAKWGVNGVTASWCTITFLILILTLVIIHIKHEFRFSIRAAFNQRIIKQIWKLCSWMSISLAGVMILSNMDTFCLTWFGSLDAVAQYNIALPIMQILQMLMVLPIVFMPIASELWQKGKYQEIRKIFFIVNGFLLLGTIPLCILFYFIGEWVIILMFGKQFITASPALTILSGGILFYVMAQFNLNLLNSTGRQKQAAAIVLLTILVNLCLNIMLIPSFGFIGAAYALSGSYLLIAVLSFLVCRNKLNSR